ncbi:MAG: hypothetical protein ACI9R3_001743 [Verrucomicrobiales bacterium]|jgi:hypothetical protein
MNPNDPMDAPETSTEPSQAGLAAIPWNRLLRDIHNHQILPIIGPDLITVEENGKQVPFVNFLAPKLASRLGLVPGDHSTLNRVACAHLVNRGRRRDIYEELRELVEENLHLPVPAGLSDLAAIRDFDLFITSTFDDFLNRALQQSRPGWKPDDRGLAAFHPTRPVDLPDAFSTTFLYHVLGSFNTYPDFAV